MSAYYIGAKVHLTISDGLYEGTIHNVDSVQKKISLKKVIVLPGGKELTGIHNFFSSDIVGLEVVDISDKPEKVISSQAASPTRPCVKPDDIDGAAQHTLHSTQNATLSSDNVQYTGTKSPKTKKVSKAVYQASDLFILTTLDDRFYEAVEDLQQQTEVGLAMEGIDVGRNGIISLVQFSTRDKLYIFDIGCLGRKAFGNGIGDIIENDQIIKVIHDCRPLSDLLYHEYGLRLTNVFDTQVADVIVYKREHYGNLPSRVKSLPACLMEYMDNIEQEVVQFMMVQEKLTRDDPGLWQERPLDNRLLKYADKRVRILLQLRDMLMHYMMKDFRIGVQEYLSTWRDKTSTREKERVSAYASVPKSVNAPQQDIPAQPKQEETTERYFDRDIVSQPGYWSREAWNEGRQFHEGDANEKYSWYREMQSQQASATNGVAAGLEKDENDHKDDLTGSTRKPYKHRTLRKFKSDQEMTVKLSEKPNPIIQTDNSVGDNDVKSSNEEMSNQSSSSLPSSSDNELLTTTSTESSPYRAQPSKTLSPYRVLADSVRNNSAASSENKFNSQITKLTLKDISRDLQLTSQSPPPLISSDGSSTLDEQHPDPCVTCFEQAPVFDNHMSYATAVSGEKSTLSYRPESPNLYGPKKYTSLGRGTALKSYPQLLENVQRPKESPISRLRGNAVRCDFPSDSVVKNAPRGITVLKDSYIFGMERRV